jgi:hypothetical protein
LLMKLWVLPESTKINKGCFSTLLVTHRVFNPATLSKALRDRWGLWVTCSTSITPSPSLHYPSSSITHKEYNLLFWHRWPGTNFSSHQKQRPLALLLSKSFFFYRPSDSADLVGVIGWGSW